MFSLENAGTNRCSVAIFVFGVVVFAVGLQHIFKKTKGSPQLELNFRYRFLILAALCLGIKTNLNAGQVNDPYDLVDDSISAEHTNEPDSCVEENGSFFSSLRSFDDWPREKKVIALNMGAGGMIVGLGMASWDYGSSSFHSREEGWFGHGNRYGGADKFGHVFGTYSLATVYNNVYKRWGYSDKEAVLGGVLSGWSQMTLAEIGDGFSASQGFSWEDEAMNTVGAAVAYLRYRYASLKDKVDFRMEWLPSPSFRDGERHDPFTDYSGQKYLLAFKADGFLKTENPLLKALELHLGYCTRGYASNDDLHFSGKHRFGSIGIGFNVTYLLTKLTGHRAAGIFDYIQVPYTYISTSGCRD